ncbi:hypothetical protein [Pontivivens ytuae]|uniref:Uncharacterized protein n=1 Tax=Pontivivens ytuae TaxID=2789856 RepID=A0A7S9LRV1_9RHOB|nr:hypothetical protein [Pontivivens ytuae]QPH53830.1 hypothetical protein I0K15_18960 [Pontivivens ytuae]
MSGKMTTAISIALMAMTGLAAPMHANTVRFGGTVGQDGRTRANTAQQVRIYTAHATNPQEELAAAQERVAQRLAAAQQRIEALRAQGERYAAQMRTEPIPETTFGHLIGRPVEGANGELLGVVETLRYDRFGWVNAVRILRADNGEIAEFAIARDTLQSDRIVLGVTRRAFLDMLEASAHPS